MWNKYKDTESRECIKCGELKNINDFFLRKHKLHDGSITVRPRSYCKKCNTKVSAKWKCDNPEKYSVAQESYKPRRNKLAKLKYVHRRKLGPIMPKKLYFQLWKGKTIENNPEYRIKLNKQSLLWHRQNKGRGIKNQRIRLKDKNKLAYHNSATYFNSIGVSIYDVPKELIDLKVKQIKLHRLIYKH